MTVVLQKLYEAKIIPFRHHLFLSLLYLFFIRFVAHDDQKAFARLAVSSMIPLGVRQWGAPVFKERLCRLQFTL